ncbi:MAG: hypothetical protein MK180_17085 [Rhodobacteraceae bacterium]|nr:hypothetical protein [Paracoccaceae bacterium]
MALFDIKRWAGILVFFLAGGAAACFAFVTVNLFDHAMASRDFIRKFGWLAVENGALWQVAELIVWGSVALACWVTFKICETELGLRYHRWTGTLPKAKRAEENRPDQVTR